MYFTEKEIKELAKDFENNLRATSSKKSNLSNELASIQRWLMDNQIETKKALETAIKKIGNGAKVKKKCSRCNHLLKYQGDRKRKVFVGKLGTVEISRAYYTCSNSKCKHTEYPLDKILGLSKQKVGGVLEETICLLSAHMPFDHVCAYLDRSEGISITQKQVWKTAEANGNSLIEKEETLAEGYRRKIYKNLDVCESKTECLYCQIDGSMVPIRGDKEVIYKENKLSILFDKKDIIKNKKGKSKIMRKRFVSSLGNGVEHFEQLLSKKAFEMGSSKSKKIVVISDGAEWIDQLRKRLFPNSIHILDWYHAVEHLYGCGRKVFGEEKTQKIEAWVAPFKELLHDGCIEAICEKLLFEVHKYKKHETSIRKLYNYYRSRKEKMRYANFRRAGYFIGSGAIESANKYLVQARLKQAGMKWTKKGAEAILMLRQKIYEKTWGNVWDNRHLELFLQLGSTPITSPFIKKLLTKKQLLLRYGRRVVV